MHNMYLPSGSHYPPRNQLTQGVVRNIIIPGDFLLKIRSVTGIETLTLVYKQRRGTTANNCWAIYNRIRLCILLISSNQL